jgi:hypothetical protein
VTLHNIFSNTNSANTPNAIDMSREETTPNQTQNENSRSPQASVEDEVEEEAGKQEQNNVPNGTHDIPHADGVEYGAGNEIRAFVRAEEDTRKEVMPTTLQIRLVLLGRAEAGKSTVISRVFDVPEKEVCLPLDDEMQQY